MGTSSDFLALNIAILTVSDTRTPETDSSGNWLAHTISSEGHRIAEHVILPDDKYALRAKVSQWIADTGINVVITTGGTGFTQRDDTPEAIRPLLDREMPGFGEMFRVLSFDEIGTSSLQSRAVAGVANKTFVFCLPGSSGACRTAWNQLIRAQLDSRTQPCNLPGLLDRL